MCRAVYANPNANVNAFYHECRDCFYSCSKRCFTTQVHCLCVYVFMFLVFAHYFYDWTMDDGLFIERIQLLTHPQSSCTKYECFLPTHTLFVWEKKWKRKTYFSCYFLALSVCRYSLAKAICTINPIYMANCIVIAQLVGHLLYSGLTN